MRYETKKVVIEAMQLSVQTTLGEGEAVGNPGDWLIKTPDGNHGILPTSLFDVFLQPQRVMTADEYADEVARLNADDDFLDTHSSSMVPLPFAGATALAPLASAAGALKATDLGAQFGATVTGAGPEPGLFVELSGGEATPAAFVAAFTNLEGLVGWHYGDNGHERAVRKGMKWSQVASACAQLAALADALAGQEIGPDSHVLKGRWMRGEDVRRFIDPAATAKPADWDDFQCTVYLQARHEPGACTMLALTASTNEGARPLTDAGLYTYAHSQGLRYGEPWYFVTWDDWPRWTPAPHIWRAQAHSLIGFWEVERDYGPDVVARCKQVLDGHTHPRMFCQISLTLVAFSEVTAEETRAPTPWEEALGRDAEPVEYDLRPPEEENWTARDYALVGRAPPIGCPMGPGAIARPRPPRS